jgi:alkanesulfonate monooxygenase SsuD/methylene tetrahydromethanopterin reductase-like flavin-dependent oxidoreductase (luciferase family)
MRSRWPASLAEWPPPAAHDRLAVIAAVRTTSARPTLPQRRLADLAEHGDVLDSCLFTAPVRYGGAGAGSSWLVGSVAEVAAALRAYGDLGVTHFVLSDTPYKSEVVRIGNQVLPLL